jgi:chitosanase
MTPKQKATAQAIVNVFETGEVEGDYGNVTVIPGDSGHLTYGRSQTTLTSFLYELLSDYCSEAGAQFASEIKPYLSRVKAQDIKLDNEKVFHRILRKAGEDPVMQRVQDEFFDRRYWVPAMERARQAGIVSPLGCAVVYDSQVHGSWDRIRQRTNTRAGGSATLVGEKLWIKTYVATRRTWLATHSNSVLHATVYRMDTFNQYVADGNWELRLPLKAQGVTITADALHLPKPPKTGWSVVLEGYGDPAEFPSVEVFADGRAIAPIRDLAMRLGAEVVWTPEGTEVNGEVVPVVLTVKKPVGTTQYSYVREIAEAAGGTVSANLDERTITVTK